MTPEQALQVLDKATQPHVTYVRIDYCNMQHALEVIKAALEELEEFKKEK